MKIAIKSGHLIGRDPGACGNGLEEARIVEAVQNECSRVLRANYVVDILDTDKIYTDDVPEINTWGADYAFEFHMNAASATAKGFETLVYPEPNSTNMQNKIHGKFYESVKSLGITSTDRGKKTASDFYFLKGLKAPSMIVEIAFISNPSEAKKASEQAVKLGERFAKDIASAFGLKSKTPPPPTSGKTYRVVTGSFSDRKNADKRIADLKAKGFDSFIEIK
ncbi:MAG: N-acetylmuramoyl-L-alanine amidase [Culicoidibacterales bacterium]